MSLLYPLGLLGLIGIAILILIYIIRPNYQTKFISSTFVWKLSLKYKKKKLPTSKLRNILLIICQVLILAIMAMILTKPGKIFKAKTKQAETIAILDAGASMRTGLEGETRFEKAVDEIKKLSEETFLNGGLFSVILADKESSFLCQRISSENKSVIDEICIDLVSEDTMCSYGSSDVNKSIELCEEILVDNPEAEIYMYTDTTFRYIPKKINVVNMSDANEEWNAAIINAYVEMIDNYYDIIVEVACYGRDEEIGINILVDGANAADKNSPGTTLKFTGDIYKAYCENDEVTRVVFKGTQGYELPDDVEYYDITSSAFFSFNSISVWLEEDDTFTLDNTFQIYGGQKEVLKIQYSSTSPNTFVSSVLFSIRNSYQDKFDIQLTEEKKGNPQVSGFDYYIFEHFVPGTLPTDGVVIILDPTANTNNTDFTVGSIYDFHTKPLLMTQEDYDSPLVKDLNINDILVSRISKITYYDASYTVLASLDNSPTMMYKDQGKSKIFVMNFSVHYSDIALKVDFPFLFRNIIDYYTPSTVTSNAYEVYERIDLASRSQKISVTKDGVTSEYTEFPITFNADTPGTYTINQTTYFGNTLNESIYVRIPRAESNIFKVEDTIIEPYASAPLLDLFSDWLFYFALALVILIFLEWWLKSRDNV